MTTSGPVFRGRRAAAFTLIELLVVLAILGVLASLLMPALGRAKDKARNVACLGNLRQLGIAVRTYADDREALLPLAELLPSQPINPAAPLPRIRDVLAAELGHSDTNSGPGVFRCPSDRTRRFEREGSSYEWNIELNGRRLDETRTDQVRMVIVVAHQDGETHRAETNRTLAFPPETTPLLIDYEDFHPRPPRSAKNAVYMDGHVATLDGMLE